MQFKPDTDQYGTFPCRYCGAPVGVKVEIIRDNDGLTMTAKEPAVCKMDQSLIEMGFTLDRSARK